MLIDKYNTSSIWQELAGTKEGTGVKAPKPVDAIEAKPGEQQAPVQPSVQTSASSVTSYNYEMSPDGRPYVVGSDVRSSIETGDGRGSTHSPSRQPGALPYDSAPQELRGEVVDGVSPPGGQGKPDSPTEVPSDKDAAPDSAKGEATSRSEDDPEVRAQVKELQATEREVIAHEQAHMAVGGQYAGGVSYTYTDGPDGKQYITGGEVPISMPATDDPEEALEAATQVQRAALAPANPSSQDLAVAANAAQIQAQARAEISRENAEEMSGEGEESSNAAPIPGQTSPANRPEQGDDYWQRYSAGVEPRRDPYLEEPIIGLTQGEKQNLWKIAFDDAPRTEPAPKTEAIRSNAFRVIPGSDDPDSRVDAVNSILTLNRARRAYGIYAPQSANTQYDPIQLFDPSFKPAEPLRRPIINEPGGYLDMAV